MTNSPYTCTLSPTIEPVMWMRVLPLVTKVSKLPSSGLISPVKTFSPKVLLLSRISKG